jgi:predicted O-methyltransferase YrrM
MTTSQSPTPVKAPAHVLSFLDRLHELSTIQEEAVTAEDYKTEGFDNFMRDKFIALDQDKCEFVYQLCLAINAKNIVEAGTSFGVSTIYLALAVFNNTNKSGAAPGTVIATEWEKSKADKAREHWNVVGDEITKCIDLREGDILETLKDGLPEVDLLLLDSKYILSADCSDRSQQN